jgi:hypothetical protein
MVSVTIGILCNPGPEGSYPAGCEQPMQPVEAELTKMPELT